MVADRIPVLLRPVRPQRLAAGVQRDRVEVREVAPLLLVEEEAVEEIDGHPGVVEDARVAGDAVGLGRAGQGVDLLVGGDGHEVVAELRGEDFLLALAVDVDAVVPVDDLLVRVVEPHVFAEVFGPLLGPFQVAVVAGQQVRGGESVDEARDGVRLLPVVVPGLLAGELDGGAVVRVVHRAGAELGLEVEVAQRRDLLHPPVAALEHKLVRFGADEGEVLGLEDPASGFRVIGPVGVHVPAGREQIGESGRCSRCTARRGCAPSGRRCCPSGGR